MNHSLLFFRCLLGFPVLCDSAHILNLDRHGGTPALDSRTHRAFHVFPRPSFLEGPLGRSTGLSSKATLWKESVRNFMDVQYTASFDLGTPMRRVKLVFDTGSSDLWVSENASSFDDDSTWSTEHVGVERTQVLEYGKGSVEGEAGSDKVCLPTVPAALCIYDQPLILARAVNSINLTQMDGILGLAFAGISSSDTTFLHNLAQQFHDMSFGFFLSAAPNQSFVVFGERGEVMQHGPMGLQPHTVASVPVEQLAAMQEIMWENECLDFFTSHLFISPLLALIFGCFIWNSCRSEKYPRCCCICRGLCGCAWCLLAISLLITVFAIIKFSGAMIGEKTQHKSGFLDVGWWTFKTTARVSATVWHFSTYMGCVIPLLLIVSLCLYCCWHCCCRKCPRCCNGFLKVVAFVWFLFYTFSPLGISFPGPPLPFDAAVTAAVDTGTSLLMMPRHDGHRVASAMFGYLVGDCFWVSVGEMSQLLCDCSVAEQAEPLSFDIGGTRVTVAAQDMFIPVDETICLTGLGIGDLPFWILGDVFMRNFYVVHNYEQRSLDFFPKENAKAEQVELAVADAEVASSGSAWTILAVPGLLVGIAGGLVPWRVHSAREASGLQPLLEHA